MPRIFLKIPTGALFAIEAYNPEQNGIQLKGTAVSFIVSGEGGIDVLLRDLSAKLIHEDGKDAKFEELQTRLQEGVRNGEGPRRGWYWV